MIGVGATGTAAWRDISSTGSAITACWTTGSATSTVIASTGFTIIGAVLTGLGLRCSRGSRGSCGSLPVASNLGISLLSMSLTSSGENLSSRSILKPVWVMLLTGEPSLLYILHNDFFSPVIPIQKVPTPSTNDARYRIGTLLLALSVLTAAAEGLDPGFMFDTE